MRKIADPLRKFARAASNDKEVIAHIDAIADQIDSEHERRMEQQSCELHEELQKMLDEMQEQREHWADEATKMYRLFFSHEEYCVPESPSEMVAVAVKQLQEKYIRQAYALACENGNPITKGIIVEDACKLGIEVDD